MTPMIVEHPLLQHKLSILRNKQTGTKEFRDLVGEIATLLCYEATRDLPLEEVEIETPITMAKTKVLAGRKLALVPILRAGMGMLDGMLTLLPAAKVGFIGLYRDEDTSLACSAQTQREIDQKVVELVKAQHEKAVKILTDNRAKLDELAQYLYQKETITGEEFMEILNRDDAE